MQGAMKKHSEFSDIEGMDSVENMNLPSIVIESNVGDLSKTIRLMWVRHDAWNYWKYVFWVSLPHSASAQLVAMFPSRHSGETLPGFLRF